MVNNTSNKPAIFALILLLSLFLLFSTIAFAIPNSLTIQGKLTNIAGASQQGTFNFTFKIYDNATSGNELWASINQSITTDANGIYDTILTGLNLSFADQYYLGIAVQGENESIPRINLTSAPYSFRANISEALNPNQSYVVRNLSITGNATIGDGTSLLEISTQRFNATTSGNLILANNITLGDKIVFRLGEIMDNLVDGWLKVTGALNVTSSLIVTGGANITGDLTVNNTFNVTASSGNVNVAGILDAGGLRVIGRIVQVEADAFKIVNYTNEYSSTGFKIANATALIDNATIIRTYLLQSALSNNTDANFTNLTVKSLLLGWTNLTNYPSACPSGQFVTTVGDTLTCAIPSPSSGGGWTDDDGIIRLATLTDIVSIGSNASLAKLYVNDSSAAGAFLITNASGTTIFFVNGSTARIGIGNTTTPVDTLTIIGSTSVFGSLNATFINATEIRVGANIVQVEADAFKRANVSDYLGGADVNASLVKSTNTTFLNLFSRVVDAFSRANLTDFFGDSGFNGSVLRVSNMSNIRESLFNLLNLTNYFGDAGFNGSVLRVGNISNIRESTWNFANNESAVLDNNTIVRAGNMSGWSRVIDSWNWANNETLVLDNATIIRTENLSLIFLERNSSLWNRTNANTYLKFITDNVGIGTITPDNLLTILGNELTANAILHLNASDNFNKSVINLIVLDHVLKSPVNSTGGVGVSILFRATDNASQTYKIANISAILYNSTNGSQLGALTFSTVGADTGDGSFGHLTERLRIDGYGRIGVNDSTPSETLDLTGTLRVVSGSGTEGLFVNPSGNVGIGTTSPGQTLHVVGSANISTTLNAPVINTTRSDQNITISSSAGSVIIRLG